jgi:hypothetical protein
VQEIRVVGGRKLGELLLAEPGIVFAEFGFLRRVGHIVLLVEARRSARECEDDIGFSPLFLRSGVRRPRYSEGAADPFVMVLNRRARLINRSRPFRKLQSGGEGRRPESSRTNGGGCRNARNANYKYFSAGNFLLCSNSA